MSSPFLPFDEVNPWSDVASPMSGEAEYTTKPEILDAAVNLDEVVESRSGILGDSFVHPFQPLSTYSISQKGDYFREVPKLDSDDTNWADFKDNWLYVAYAAEIGHLVEAKFEPPKEPELGTRRGANAAYDNELHAFRAYKLLENQCRVFLVQKLPSDVRRDVMDDASCCRDIWLNLARRFQVKVKNDTADLKARWMLTTCGEKENLDEWLMKDKAIIKSILDMGGHVIIYDELRCEYNSRNPKLPEWAKSKEKAEKSSKDSGSKSDHALLTEEAKKKKKPDMSKIKCYGCKKLGHFRRDCPDEDEKDKKKGKKDKEKKSKDKEKSKEGGKDESKSKEGSDLKSHATSCSKSGEKESQVNVAEEIEYAYVADAMFGRTSLCLAFRKFWIARTKVEIPRMMTTTRVSSPPGRLYILLVTPRMFLPKKIGTSAMLPWMVDWKMSTS
ncbi:hypothetical protein K435DRAFT_802145 [Dendrothele bispora CBS 962.96]|uniref:CCHC-type domain-containing protein n=1 Tax=Dendrothele bispora (strain CBS 962.96) TaxID=1314807 RepID=A0A4S8LNB4_DENBC|nr:hypothetical protein K435DRAFT_802145 [Dendrothele bispora CBS 962.96]